MGVARRVYRGRQARHDIVQEVLCVPHVAHARRPRSIAVEPVLAEVRGYFRRDVITGEASRLERQPSGSRLDAGPRARVRVALEGLAERANCLKASVSKDSFGKAALAAGVPRKALDSWFVDPRVRVKGGEAGSVFDMLEDLDADECLAAMLTIERE